MSNGDNYIQQNIRILIQIEETEVRTHEDLIYCLPFYVQKKALLIKLYCDLLGCQVINNNNILWKMS